MKKLSGPLMLLLAAFLWGTTFVAQTSAADTVECFTFNASRSVLATVFLGIIILVNMPREKRINPDAKNDKGWILGGAICGALLFLASYLQQFGISVYPEDAAASGRSGFLTATYVVMVSVYSIFAERKMHLPIVVATIGCMAGMYLLCLSNGIDRLYTGDIYVFLCAVVFAVHLLVIDKFSKSSGIKMSFMQFAVCGLLSFICMLIFETPSWSVILDSKFEIMYAGIFSSGIAYTLQIIGQKGTNPTAASIILSLESVFALLAGWAIDKENLPAKQIFGCILVFLSVILAQLPDNIFSLKKSTSQKT